MDKLEAEHKQGLICSIIPKSSTEGAIRMRGPSKRGNTTWEWVVTLICLDKEMTEHKCNGMELVYKYDR